MCPQPRECSLFGITVQLAYIHILMAVSVITLK
jgi:hypothetical protein